VSARTFERLHVHSTDMRHTSIGGNTGGTCPQTHGNLFQAWRWISLQLDSTYRVLFLLCIFLPPFAASLYNNSPLSFLRCEHGACFVAFSRELSRFGRRLKDESWFFKIYFRTTHLLAFVLLRMLCIVLTRRKQVIGLYTIVILKFQAIQQET